jgi:hypothetical protein
MLHASTISMSLMLQQLLSINITLPEDLYYEIISIVLVIFQPRGTSKLQ